MYPGRPIYRDLRWDLRPDVRLVSRAGYRGGSDLLTLRPPHWDGRPLMRRDRCGHFLQGEGRIKLTREGVN